MIDYVSVQMRRSAAAEKCLHPAMNVSNETTDQAFVPWAGDVVWTPRMFTDGSVRNAGAGASGINYDIGLPADTTLNGVRGLTPQEIEDNAVILGVCENPGSRDNGTDRFNIVTGGALTRPNNDTTGHAAGDYLIACCPDKDGDHGRARMPSNARVSDRVGSAHNAVFGQQSPNAAGTQPVGRVTWQLRKFKPEDVNFYDLRTIRHLIGNAKDDDVKRIAENHSTTVQEKYLLAHVDLLAAAYTLASELGIKGVPADMHEGDKAKYERRLDNLKALKRAVVVGGKLTDKVLAGANAFMMHQHAQLRMRVMNRVCARVITGARSGDDEVIQLFQYT